MLQRMHGFTIERPLTLREAFICKREFVSSAAYLAGGTDVFVHLKTGRANHECLIDLSAIPELQSVEWLPDGGLLLGSMVTARSIECSSRIRETYPALSAGAGMLGSVQIRNLATVGGNVCNAAPSGDCIAPLMAIGAMCRIYGEDGYYEKPIEDIFVKTSLTTLRDDILVGLRLPPARQPNYYHYEKHCVRHNMDLAMTGVCIYIEETDGIVSKCRIALGAVSPNAVLASKAASLLLGNRLNPKLAREAGETARTECNPNPRSYRASGEYRRDMVSVLVEKEILDAMDTFERLGEAE